MSLFDARAGKYDDGRRIPGAKALSAASPDTEIDKAAPDVLLTGRAEGFISGVPDLEQMIARLKAYADAGGTLIVDAAGGSPGRLSQHERSCKRIHGNPVHIIKNLVLSAHCPDK